MSQFESSRAGAASPTQLIRKATEGLPVKVTEIIPRVKDGGAFVKFRYEGDATPGEVEGTVPLSILQQLISC